MTQVLKPCAQCGIQVPPDKLHFPIVGLGMVCASCLYQMIRENEARKQIQARKDLWIAVLFSRPVLGILGVLIMLLLIWIDKSGFINIFGD